jgi:hypothetical protein
MQPEFLPVHAWAFALLFSHLPPQTPFHFQVVPINVQVEAYSAHSNLFSETQEHIIFYLKTKQKIYYTLLFCYFMELILISVKRQKSKYFGVLNMY